MTLFVRMAVAIALTLAAASAQGQDLIVEKKTFELPQYTTAGGATIKGVKVGWESYGELNADRSNAILVTHFFSGTSHAAGKYKPEDRAPGYWDPIIGPGKAIDTNRYFVISSDTLVNLSPKDPNVVTTGPATIDPATGKPYGLSFPVVSIRDFVNVQKALLDSLGIRKLKAVVGASMGALQAYEWAVAYPEMVDRIVPVIGAAGGDAYLGAWVEVWGAPIRLDPKWKRLRPARPAEGGPRGGPEGRDPARARARMGGKELRRGAGRGRQESRRRDPEPVQARSRPRCGGRGPASPMPTTCSTSWGKP